MRRPSSTRFNYAFEGIIHVLRTQRNMRIHFMIAAGVLVAAVAIGVTRGSSWSRCCVAIAFVMFAEMINTAIEGAVDVSTTSFDPNAKLAKDIAAGAVLIATVTAVAVGYLVFSERLADRSSRLLERLSEAPAELTLVALVLTTIAVIGTKALTAQRHAAARRASRPGTRRSRSPAGWRSRCSSTEQQFLVSSVAFVLALLVAQTRVESGIHSPLEVFWGALLGALTALVGDPGRSHERRARGDEGLLRRPRARVRRLVVPPRPLRPRGGGQRALGAPRRPRSRRRWTRCARSAASSSSPRARACGRGTSSATPTRVLAIDASHETLELNRSRSGGRAEYRVADVFAWEPEERFDLCVFGFWLSHVPESRFDAFWDTVRRASDRFFLVDSAAGDPAAHLWERSGEREVRRLSDGREFEIVKRRWSPETLGARASSALGWATDLRTSSGGSLVYGTGTAGSVTGAELVERAETARAARLRALLELPRRRGRARPRRHASSRASTSRTPRTRSGCARSGRPSRAQSSRATARATSRPSGSPRRPAADAASGCTSSASTGSPSGARTARSPSTRRPSCSRTRGTCPNEVSHVPGAALGVRCRRAQCGARARRAACVQRRQPSAERGSAAREPKAAGGVRSGFVAVAGRPNVGKSTLVNALCGGKVAIVSDKPQTTRRRIFGIANGDDYQLVLADLPGFQRPRDPLTEHMQRTVRRVLRGRRGRAVRAGRARARSAPATASSPRSVFALGVPVVIALNKVDRLKPGHIAQQMQTGGAARRLPRAPSGQREDRRRRRRAARRARRPPPGGPAATSRSTSAPTSGSRSRSRSSCARRRCT